MKTGLTAAGKYTFDTLDRRGYYRKAANLTPGFIGGEVQTRDSRRGGGRGRHRQARLRQRVCRPGRDERSDIRVVVLDCQCGR
jgi:hypothetical protein